jgi:hypothetical protein
VDAKTGDPLPEFYDRLAAGYADPTPHRHKFDRKFIQAQGLKNANIPAYSVRRMPDGSERHYTYVESRYFYCRQYELLAPQSAEFKQLCDWRNNGMNLQIVGYDGYDVTDTLMNHYLDDTRPFGHELVLYTLLTVDDPFNYPWNRFRHQHPDLYDQVPY